jgi:hypothetical protein
VLHCAACRGVGGTQDTTPTILKKQRILRLLTKNELRRRKAGLPGQRWINQVYFYYEDVTTDKERKGI